MKPLEDVLDIYNHSRVRTYKKEQNWYDFVHLRTCMQSYKCCMFLSKNSLKDVFVNAKYGLESNFECPKHFLKASFTP